MAVGMGVCACGSGYGSVCVFAYVVPCVFLYLCVAVYCSGETVISSNEEPSRIHSRLCYTRMQWLVVREWQL